jgi:FkbM family methyltransferase
MGAMRRFWWRLADSRFLRRFRPERLHQQWEENHLRRLLAHYRVDCVFDVGANQGQYARMLRKVGYRGLIVSFEPVPEIAAALRDRAAADGRWLVVQQALAGHDGEQTFNVMRGDQFSSLSNPRHDDVDLFRDRNQIVRSLAVTTSTLASAFERLRAELGFVRPFLKLDTQGYDTEIVRGSRSTMRHFVGLQSELAIVRLYESSIDFREALELYQECGFELSAFVPNNEGRFPRLIEVDCIMVRADLLAVDAHATPA